MDRTSDPALAPFDPFARADGGGFEGFSRWPAKERKASIERGSDGAGRDTLERARRGDVDAFEALVAPHVPTVRRLAHAFERNWSDADDLAQDALVRAFRSIATFEGRSAFSTWLYVVVRSTFLDAKRARRRPERFADGELDDVEDGSREAQDATIERKDESERLWSAIERLDATFRIALVLFAVEGMSYEEIAEIEAVPIGTVRSRIARARAQLAELLEKDALRAEAAARRVRSDTGATAPRGAGSRVS